MLYKVVLNDRDMLGICRKFEGAFKTKLDKSFSGPVRISRDLFLELATSLYISAIRWWLNNDMKYTPSFLAKELVKYMTASPCNIIGIDIETGLGETEQSQN